MNIHILQHVSFESPGMISAWAKERGHQEKYTLLFEEKHVFPSIDDFELLVIMGGPMGAGEESRFPWLIGEKKFIRESISAGKKILGICLGSQLLAEALGARVYRNRQMEIGFFPIEKTGGGKAESLLNPFSEKEIVLHWHGETFDLPAGATRLFSSGACYNQGFIKANSIGLQFHPEIDSNLLQSMVDNERHELVKAEYVQSEQEILNYDAVEKNRGCFYSFLDLFAGQS